MFSRLGFGSGGSASGGGGTPTKRTEEVTTPPTVVTPPRVPRVVAPAGPAKAVRLVYTDDKGRFRMDAEAVAALQLVKGPLGVVSVCGRARQGKSFILNQLLGRSSGFQVGPTHRPCTKGLWMWSAPLKKTAPDGTEYNLLLLDSEGIDAYDQTGTYSTQIFSLAVLLSSMFVYNQMGGIDEAALDRLSLVTEMTKHIRVRASQNQTSVEELGQFAPVFLWLLRDFYLDLNEDGRKITPREYLESALQPMAGTSKAVYSKNEIRESIRALFPDRHCFTLVRPVNKEHDLQRLDTIPMDKMRPEFRQGLDNLTRFVLERTRPKQVGATIMTGPVLAALTQSFLDAINAGAVPTIATSWQNVEENECRRAYEMALEAYMASFDKSTPVEQVRGYFIRSSDGTSFQESLQEIYDAALQESLAVYSSEAVGVGPVKTRFEKQLVNAAKKHFEEFKKKASIEAELRCVSAVSSMEEKLRMSSHAANASYEQLLRVLTDLVHHYEITVAGPAKWQKLVKFLQQSLEGPLSDAVKKMMNQAASQVSSLELKCRSLEERLALTGRQIESAQREALDWKKRYENAIADYKTSTELSASQYAGLQGKISKLEERRGAIAQQLEAAAKEAHEWQSKYEHLIAEQRTDEERFKSEFAGLQSRCSAAEARLAAAREQSQGAKEEAAEWRRKHDAVLSEARSTAERYNALRERGSKQSQQREDALRAEFSSSLAQKDILLSEVHTKLEQSEHLVTDLRTRMQAQDSKIVAMEAVEQDLQAKVEVLQKRLEEKEHEAEVVLLNAHEQRASTVSVLQGLLDSERAAHAEASTRAETLSVQLQNAQAKLDALQHELATSRLNETAMESKLRTQAESSGRRKRGSDEREEHEHEHEDMETTPPTEGRSRKKRPRLDFDNGSSQGATPGESISAMDDHGSTELQRDTLDYKKFTINILKQELTKAGYGAQILQLRNAPKREYIALYEKYILNKPN